MLHMEMKLSQMRKSDNYDNSHNSYEKLIVKYKCMYSRHASFAARPQEERRRKVSIYILIEVRMRGRIIE